MKLLVILCIKEFEEALHQLLKSEKVPVFSQTDVKGYTYGESALDISNWFGQSGDPSYSVMVFTFTDENMTDNILQKINGLNEGSVRPCHAFALPVETYV